MRKTRRRRQKAKRVFKELIKLMPFVLIFTIGVTAFVKYFKKEVDDAKEYDDLVKELTIDVEAIPSTPKPIIEEAVEEAIQELEPVEEEIVEEKEVYSTNLLDDGYEFKEIDFDELNNINEDAVAWVELKGTKIDYPVVQGEDNDYYLHHDINGNNSVAGVIYQDVRSFSLGDGELSDLSVLYGHHLKQGRMFSGITKFKNPEYVKEHPYAVIYGEDGSVYQAEFFAGRVVTGNTDEGTFVFQTADGYYIYGFENEEHFNNYIQELKEVSTFETDVDINYGDKILAFVCCSYETNNSRYILYSKLSRQYTNYEEMEETSSLVLKR